MYGAVNHMVWQEPSGTEQYMELSIIWCGRSLQTPIDVWSCQSLQVGGPLGWTAHGTANHMVWEEPLGIGRAEREVG